MTTAHSPQYNADGSVTLQATFPWLSGEVPFTASPNDPEAHGRELHARALAGEFGPIAAYVAPPPPAPVVPQRVEMAQARLALHQAGYLTSVEAAMAALPKAAQIEWEFRSHVARQSPLVSAMQGVLTLTDQQVDDLFTLAGTL
jgi:hypothetical protein